MDLLEKCELCPRKCGINRYKETGFCGLNEKIKVFLIYYEKIEKNIASLEQNINEIS